jgi:hypothetical protein
MRGDAGVAVLESFGRIEDHGAGLSEEYLPHTLGDDGLGLLSRPLEGGRGTAFVLVRSPGPEQGPLQRLEALVARALARQGFPSIRIRRGFEHEDGPADFSLTATLAEAEDAVAALAEGGAERVGVVGCSLGAATAPRTTSRVEWLSCRCGCLRSASPAACSGVRPPTGSPGTASPACAEGP